VGAFAEALFDHKFVTECWRGLESIDEWSRILGVYAKPKPRITAKIGVGLVVLEADQANADVLVAGHFALPG